MRRRGRAGGAGAHAAGAEDVAVGKELGGQVADGEAGEHDLGARVRARLQLGVDDVPLRVHDLLVLRRVAQAHLPARAR